MEQVLFKEYVSRSESRIAELSKLFWSYIKSNRPLTIIHQPYSTTTLSSDNNYFSFEFYARNPSQCIAKWESEMIQFVRYLRT